MMMNAVEHFKLYNETIEYFVSKLEIPEEEAQDIAMELLKAYESANLIKVDLSDDSIRNLAEFTIDTLLMKARG